MELYEPTIDEIERLTWKDFLEATKTKFWVVTHEQWGTLLARKITGTTDLLVRVNNLFSTTPVIGITNDGRIVIRTWAKFNPEALDMDFTWITAWFMGTVTNTDVKVNTVDTNKVADQVITFAIEELISITTDDLKNVPLINFTHNVPSLTKGGYTYCDGKIETTPVPNGAKWLAGIKLIEGHGTNAVIALDNQKLEHSGNWDAETGTWQFDPITAVEPTDETKTDPTPTSI